MDWAEGEGEWREREKERGEEEEAKRRAGGRPGAKGKLGTKAPAPILESESGILFVKGFLMVETSNEGRNSATLGVYSRVC